MEEVIDGMGRSQDKAGRLTMPVPLKKLLF
jgi:hypothetical protein